MSSLTILTSLTETVIEASCTNFTPAFLSECNPDNSPSDHPGGMTDSTPVLATHAKGKEDSYSSSVSVRTSDISQICRS